MAKTKTAAPGKRLKQYNDLVAGLTAAAPAGIGEIAVGGTRYTIPALLAKLTAHRDLLAAVAKAEAALAAALEARDAAGAETATLLRQTRAALKGALGKTSAANEDYGIAPEKEPAPLTAEQQVVKREKAAATRKARGTLGKRQRSKIHGTVPVTPAPTPAPPAPVPAPAPPAPAHNGAAGA